MYVHGFKVKTMSLILIDEPWTLITHPIYTNGTFGLLNFLYRDTRIGFVRQLCYEWNKMGTV